MNRDSRAKRRADRGEQTGARRGGQGSEQQVGMIGWVFEREASPRTFNMDFLASDRLNLSWLTGEMFTSRERLEWIRESLGREGFHLF
jgi:hypothetical protein